MRSPPPEDPSVLENHTQGESADEVAPAPTPTRTRETPTAVSRASAGAAPPQPTRTSHPLLSASHRTSRAPPAPTAKPVAKAATFDLLGDLGDSASPVAPTTTRSGPPPAVPGNRPAAAVPTSASTQLPSLAPVVETSAASKPAPSAVGSGAGLFDLDFKAPTPTSASQKPKSSTNDILSLFSASSGPPAYSQTAIPQQQRQQQQSYHQQSQSRPQQQQPAVFGQLGSYNAPPTLAPQGQTAYATWTGASGVTAPSVASPATTGLASGMAGLSMGGADVWGAAAPVSQVCIILLTTSLRELTCSLFSGFRLTLVDCVYKATSTFRRISVQRPTSGAERSSVCPCSLESLLLITGCMGDWSRHHCKLQRFSCRRYVLS